MVFPNQSSGNVQPEVKNGFIGPTEGHYSGDSHSDVFRRVKWQKSDNKMEVSKLSKVDSGADNSTANDLPTEVCGIEHLFYIYYHYHFRILCDYLVI